MENSPISSPGTPSTSSPVPYEDKPPLCTSLSPDDLHARATLGAPLIETWGESGFQVATDRLNAALPRNEALIKSFKGKEKATEGPKTLLNLPLDILRDIIHQLPHTNDLTSLALCNSALHRLAIPYIYSRFDIVWPDENTHSEPRSGVDALTYGLATLVMSDDSFPHQNRNQRQSDTAPFASNPSPTPYPLTRRRFGNYYAQFTKKFSLGNGPAAWVQEYTITKEGGKMLGTLVALAIARMINLETFVWDMPTGVLRDVWRALSSIADRTDGEECRLDRLWIRWHDSTVDAPVPPPAPPMILNNVDVLPPPNTTHPSAVGAFQPPAVVPHSFQSPTTSAMDRIEYPTFSVIPALKSLSVLDIDELSYLDEMSILIARSQRKLRELRIGIAPHAQKRDWVTAWEGKASQQVDYKNLHPGESTISEKRLGGVLGIIVGRVHNLRHSEEQIQTPQHPSATVPASRQAEAAAVKPAAANTLSQHDRETEAISDNPEAILDETTLPRAISLSDDLQSFSIDLAPHSVQEEFTENVAALKLIAPIKPTRQTEHDIEPSRDADLSTEPKLTGKLNLEILELERVPLSVPVLLRAFDWTLLSTLTLLTCSNHEQLWKSLRRTYTPRPPYPAGSPVYTLGLKKIHTNTVSPSLISFLKETLAPNSLEVLFLQECRSYPSTVTVDSIYRGPLRRHRSSLKKLMIDSSDKGLERDGSRFARWRRWVLNREAMLFITSGHMKSLRELAVALDYRDWYLFLQRLPLIPHIRSLYIPFIADHMHGHNNDPRDFAYQVLNIVHLQPQIELCYMGLTTKCYEILENRPADYDLKHDHDPRSLDDESEATGDEDEDEDEDDGGLGGVDDEDTDSASDDVHDDSDDDSILQEYQNGPKLRVREILFYEERVEAFRRRHGVLRP